MPFIYYLQQLWSFQRGRELCSAESCCDFHHDGKLLVLTAHTQETAVCLKGVDTSLFTKKLKTCRLISQVLSSMQTNGWYSWKPHVVFGSQAAVDVSPENKTKHGVNISVAADIISIFHHGYNKLP